MVNNLATISGSVGSTLFGPSLQRVLASVGLSRTFLLLAGIFSVSSLVAFLYKPAAYGEEKQVTFDTRKRKKRWFDLSVLKHKPYTTFVVATSVLSVAFSATFTHMVSQIISCKHTVKFWL